MTSYSLVLYRGFPISASYVWSPFVTKLEARLRFGGLAYKIEQGAPPKGPRGKIPYLDIFKGSGAAPETVSDTALISEQLVSEGLAADLNCKISAVEKAYDLALRALLEDKLCLYQGYERWEQNYYEMRSKVLAALPWPVQVLVGQIAYRKVNATLWGVGTGRFTAEEISKFKKEVWQDVNALLISSNHKRKSRDSDELFFVLGGDAPTEADTTLFGFIASGLVCSAAPETQAILRGFPTIMDYADRIHKHYFVDYEHWN